MEDQNDKDKRHPLLPSNGDQGEGQRLFFVAKSEYERHSRSLQAPSGKEGRGTTESYPCSSTCLLADAAPERIDRGWNGGPRRRGEFADRGELGDTNGTGLEKQFRTGRESGFSSRIEGLGTAGPCNGFWRDAVWLPCRDGKARPTQPGIFPLAHGAAARVVRLRGYGDAIVAPVAEEFIRAYMEVSHD